MDSAKNKFQICEFIDCVNENGQTEFDIVPASWITYDIINKTCLAWYPESPYTKDVIALIHLKVKANLGPMPSWPSWPVLVKGGANIYKKAEERLSSLKSEAYAFTTDAGEEEDKAIEQVKLFQKESLEDIMTVANSDSSDCDESSSTDTDSSIRKARQKGGKKSNNSKTVSKKQVPAFSTKKKTVKNSKKVTTKVPSNRSKGKINKEQDKPNSNKNFSNNERQVKEGYKFSNINYSNDTFTSGLSRLKQDTFTDYNTCSTQPKLHRTSNADFMKNIEYEDINYIPDESLLAYADQTIKDMQVHAFDDVGNNTKFPASQTQIEKKKTCSFVNNEKTINFSTEGTALLTVLTKLKVTVEDIQRDVKQIKETLSGSDKQQLQKKLSELNLSLPLDHIHNWYIFDNYLTTDKDLHNYFTTMVQFNLDKSGNNSVKSTNNTLKKLFIKNLILKFTALKKVANKQIFKDSNCYSIMKNVITGYHTNRNGDFISEGDFHSALSSAFGNAKDWGGREKKIDS